MASASTISEYGGSSSQSEVRIVLLGDTRADKSEVAKSVLGCKNLTGEKIGLCTLYKGEDAGRNISVVDTPGWNRISIEQTPENIKAEIVRSVLLCPPGPDALLLVLPVKSLSEEPLTGEMAEAQKHMELLSERVWKHTIMLFDCDEGVEEESTIKEHIRSAEKILEKCKGRYLVLHRSALQKKELLKNIQHLVDENGDVFIPQIYYERIQRKSQGDTEVRQRRGSFEKIPPNLREEKEDSKMKETIESAKHTLFEDIAQRKTLKPLAVILMGTIGALIGSVAGAEYGVLGSCTGLFCGVIVGGLLAILIIRMCT